MKILNFILCFVCLSTLANAQELQLIPDKNVDTIWVGQELSFEIKLAMNESLPVSMNLFEMEGSPFLTGTYTFKPKEVGKCTIGPIRLGPWESNSFTVYVSEKPPQNYLILDVPKELEEDEIGYVTLKCPDHPNCGDAPQLVFIGYNDFDVVSTSSSSNFSFKNGAKSQGWELKYAIRPKGESNFTVGPENFRSESEEALNLEVKTVKVIRKKSKLNRN
ncbi:MAG: BatD family protein [Bacteroidia bacterium]|nr:BatD family protein [Bacteroidia bacterium]